MRGVEASLALLVLAASLLFFSVPVADNDLWGHVLFGREILANGLPSRNLYSYTEPDQPWINHEILAECALAAAYDTFGAAGLLTLKWGCGLLTLAVLAGIARRRGADPLGTTAALVLAASLMAWGYHARPQLFSFLFLALTWDAIDRVAGGRSPKSLWHLPLLFAVWVNTHGGVLAGAGILVVSVVLLGIHRPRTHERAHLATVVVIALGALLANPYGWHLLDFLARDVTIDRPISEWAPIYLFDVSNLQFKVALLFAAAGFLRAERRRAYWEIVVIAVAAVATFRHERHLPLFAIVVTPHLAGVFSALLTRFRFDRSLRQDRTTRAVVTVAASILGLVMASPAVQAHRELGLEIAVPRSGYPVDAVRFLRAQNLRGNLAVPFAWGEYAIWHLHPSFRVSIDGRYTTAYSLEATEHAWRYLDGGDGWDRHLVGADVALTDARHATARRLESSPGWMRVYEDATASVFLRDGLIASPRLAPPSALTPSLFP